MALLEPRQSEAIDKYFLGVSEPLGAAVDRLDLNPSGLDDAGTDPLGSDPLGSEGGDGPAVAEREQVAPVVSLAAHARPGAPEGGVAATWTCRLCETPNPLAAIACEVCGSSFADTMRPPEPQVTGDPNQAAMYSLFWPGAGHAYLGLWGQAWARAIMSAWVLLVTAFLLFGAGGGSSNLFAIFFGLGATALWLTAAHDAYREASGQQSMVILYGRRYLYVTGTLMGLLFLMLLTTAATAAS